MIVARHGNGGDVYMNDYCMGSRCVKIVVIYKTNSIFNAPATVLFRLSCYI